ncbi:MAG: efflux transporter outer membrane subunit [Phycisphaerales bacterium]
MRRIALSFGLAVAVAGCTVGPTYVRPEVALPGEFRGATSEVGSMADLAWWDVYEDPVLQGLIREAIANNQDLRITVARIEQARAIAAQSNALRYPQVGYGVGVSEGRNDFAGTPSFDGGQTGGSFSGILSAAWEFDLWGRLKNINQADLDIVLSTEFVRKGVRLSLVSDVAQAYFELLQIDRELEIHHLATKSFEETVRIFTLRRDYGTASNLEVARGDAALAQAASDIPRTELAAMLKENQINVLLGRAPRAIPRGEQLLQQRLPPNVPPGIPAQLMERRPDILAAEARLRAANAQIGATEALQLPQIGLSTFFGQVSPDLADFSSAGIAWSVAAAISGPIFDAGLTNAQIAQAKAVWEELVAIYDQTVFVAMREVADALAARWKLEEVRVQSAKAVAAYQESVLVATQRYMAGKSSYYEVLDAQQRLYPTEIELARTQGDQLVAVVRLYKALGGGWNMSEAQWSQWNQPGTVANATPAATSPAPAKP